VLKRRPVQAEESTLDLRHAPIVAGAAATVPDVNGSHVRVVARKWPDRPHWEHDAVRLGEDEHGTWLGAGPGTVISRPGASFRTAQAQVVLVPRAAAFVATFYARGERGNSLPCEVYVDITTVPQWTDDAVSAYDLDLDVVRGWTGRVWVDDEDEFAAHRVRYAYPPELVRSAVGSCAAVREAVEQWRPPYDGVVAQAWLDVLAELTARR
jgi:protein associated with RNAse G/E